MIPLIKLLTFIIVLAILTVINTNVTKTRITVLAAISDTSCKADTNPNPSTNPDTNTNPPTVITYRDYNYEAI